MSEEIIDKGNISFKDLYSFRNRFISMLEEELKKNGIDSRAGSGEDAYDRVKDIWTFESPDENMKWLYDIAMEAATEIRQSDTSTKQTIHRVIEYIRGHYAEKILLTSISEKYHISGTYFCRIFKKETGKNFIDFLTEVRMEKAKQLFENYSMKVHEVAELVGYKDFRHFSKLYKKHFS